MHRNSQKRIYGNYIYFITCNVHDKIDFFTESFLCELWIEELKLSKEIDNFKLLAFCLNYDHFHLLIKPNNEIANYSKIMHFLKRNFSIDTNKIMGFIFEGDDPIHRTNEREKCTNGDKWERGEVLERGDAWERRLREHREFVLKMREEFISINGKHH
ncbi:MAG: hypothetical protein APR54_03135, partial [Candidatus Cloacimonas sp. SDB]